MDVDGDQLGMHQLMALAVRAELEAEAPGSCAGVRDLQVLLTSSALSEWRATNASRRCWRRGILFLFDDTRGSYMNLIRAQ
jgi:hypothetical protein